MKVSYNNNTGLVVYELELLSNTVETNLVLSMLIKISNDLLDSYCGGRKEVNIC